MNMYSSRGSSGYGQQQPYSSQSSYTPQNLGAASLLGGGHKEAELGGYRTHGHVHGHPSGAAETVSVPPPQHYGGLYNSVYGSGAQQVFSFSFVEAERDYLSLDKRYPRLYISPECSKVAVYWPKKNLQLTLYTPVSFEHDFVEEAAAESKESPSTLPTADISKAGGQTTIWNAKVILMSGLSQNAQAELSSERIYDDRIPHFCNMLRFAVLKKNNSLMAIGGPWDTVDGGDPSVDDSSLVRTALRYAKDVTNLDLKNCQHWNRFLELSLFAESFYEMLQYEMGCRLLAFLQELVQSALLESNTGRDDRILYDKLVKMPDI
ncbi:UNVERIFIED_CONTAM: Protein SHORT ROOT IN SALT MEDIUM 1 [Sesamum indicum]